MFSQINKITAVAGSAEMHAASMDIPEVKAAVTQAMPMIAGYETVATTSPVGDWA
jgi:hypothetical protein